MPRYWLHLTTTTFGTWLRGDPRSFRTRHHREHVIGDHKRPPPPDAYAKLYEHSRRVMRRAPVFLSQSARAIACGALVESLGSNGVRIRIAGVDSHHAHVLAAVPSEHREPESLRATGRHLMGIAKSRAARLLSKQGLVAPGGVWTKRSGAFIVRGRAHFLEVEGYIADHADEGAFVWTELDP